MGQAWAAEFPTELWGLQLWAPVAFLIAQGLWADASFPLSHSERGLASLGVPPDCLKLLKTHCAYEVVASTVGRVDSSDPAWLREVADQIKEWGHLLLEGGRLEKG